MGSGNIYETDSPIIATGGGGGGGGEGTSNHPDLLNRDAANQHPLSAITNDTANGLSANAQTAINELASYSQELVTTSLTFKASDAVLANASSANTVASFVELSDGKVEDVAKVKYINHGFAVGEYYYLSELDNTFQITPPTTIGSYTQSLFYVYDANTLLINIQQAVENVEVDTGGGGGTLNHPDLTNRDAAEQHPLSAITNDTANGLSADAQVAINQLAASVGGGGGGTTQSGLYLLGRSIWGFSGNSTLPDNGGNILFPTTGTGVEIDDPLGIFGNTGFGVVFQAGATHYRMTYSFYYFNQAGTSNLTQTIDFGIETSSGNVFSFLDTHKGGFYFQNQTMSGSTIFSGTFASSIIKVSDAEHPAISYSVSSGLNSLFKSIRVDIESYKEIV